MGEILLLGLLMGTGAALAVGPIFVLIIQQSVSRGFGSGFRVILGSAVADLLMLIPAVGMVWVIRFMTEASFVVGLIGTAVFAWLGVGAVRDALRFKRSGLVPKVEADWSFTKGVVVNLASPLTWAFWLATGGPTMHRSYQAAGDPGVILFTLVWFGTAVLLEVIIAAAVAQSKRLVGPRGMAAFSGVSAAGFFALAGWLLVLTLNGSVSAGLAGMG